MRILSTTFCVLLVFTACNKKNTYSICHMTQMEIFPNNSPSFIISYQYDAAGRIKKVISGTYTNIYDYFADSVVIVMTTSTLPSASTRTTYFLNSAGIATSSKRIFNPNPNSLQNDDVYGYDAAGYLINERSIFTQVYYGTTLRDTTFRTYTVLNGDIIKKTETNSIDMLYGYSSDAMPDNVQYLNPFPSRDGSFLGRHVAHLITRADATATGDGGISYSFDQGKKVSEMRSTGPGSTINQRVVFHYACD